MRCDRPNKNSKSQIRSRLASAALGIWLCLSGCTSPKPQTREKLTIGIVSYGEGVQSIDRYARFKDYLVSQTNAVIELEPAFNEVKALEQIQRRNWSLVFAPPGLAAIAISKEKYVPLFAMQGKTKLHAVLIVRKNSKFQKITDLANQAIALGEAGSATGYYLPVFDLYGLKVAEVIFAPTPREVLKLIDQGKVGAGALSKEEYDRLRVAFPGDRFRILQSSSQSVPPGLVLLAPSVERNMQAQIVKAMQNASPTIVQEADYITNAAIPDYKFLIKVVNRVRPIVTRIKQKPAPLYEEGQELKSTIE